MTWRIIPLALLLAACDPTTPPQPEIEDVPLPQLDAPAAPPADAAASAPADDAR